MFNSRQHSYKAHEDITGNRLKSSEQTSPQLRSNSGSLNKYNRSPYLQSNYPVT